LLLQLKNHGLSSDALTTVFHALILSKVIYGLPAFAGHLSVFDIGRINKMFRKAYRRGLVQELFDFKYIIKRHDCKLFCLVQHPSHCLNVLLPPKRNPCMQLRTRGHDFTLPTVSSTLLKNSFINRCLFDTI